jgi:predicted nucleic acid-binding protein
MSTILLDTSAIIDYLQDEPYAVTLVEQIGTGTITASYSPITEAELWMGTMREQEELIVLALLRRCEFTPLDSLTARLAGELLRKRSEGERRRHVGDALIAAAAMRRGEPVVTADRSIARLFGGQVQYQVYR